MEEYLEKLRSALHSLRTLRTNHIKLLERLNDGVAEDDEGGRQKQLDIEELIRNLNINVSGVEVAVAGDFQIPAGHNLENLAELAQERPERQHIYQELVESHEWTDRAREVGAQAGRILAGNSIVKTYRTYSSSKRRRVQTSAHNVSPEVLETVITNLDGLFSDIIFITSRPMAANPIIQVTLGRVFKAHVAFKGLMIEWIMVKSHEESTDLWTESRYAVFRKVTENFFAGMCHFQSPLMPELALRSYMQWFHSYITLFSARCKRCNMYLKDSQPATWRDYRTLEPYHEGCK